jgi:mRNA interferase MazF
MRRGEIWQVDLDPVRGSEADKHRPAVIVSNDAANSTAEQLGRGVITIVPVSSNLRRVHPFQVLLPAEDTGLRIDSKALAEQVRSIDAQRLAKHVATIPLHLMAALDDALRLHLALDRVAVG